MLSVSHFIIFVVLVASRTFMAFMVPFIEHLVRDAAFHS